jgi:uncharacterized protein
MTLSMYKASVPVLQSTLQALDKILDKAEAHAAAKKIDPSVLFGARLYPDMLPFWRQVTIACDFAKGTGARLAGVDVPKFEDTEKTLPELKARIAKTLDFLKTLKSDAIEGSAAREITMTVGGNPMTFTGESYLLGFAMPNFYFHATTAYAILRHNGIEIGKGDFLGRS